MTNQITKVLILADSSALARGKSWGDIPYESTYPCYLQELLKKELGLEAPQVIERGMRFRTIVDVLREWDEQVVLKRPDVIIINVGSVDSAPRIFRRWQRDLLAKVPSRNFQNRLARWEFRYRSKILPHFPKRVDVPLNRFYQSLKKVVESSRDQGVKKLILMNTVPITDKLEILSPGWRKNVSLYNDVIASFDSESHVHVIDFCHLWEEWGGADEITVDSLHLKPQWHYELAKILSHQVLELCPCHVRAKEV